MSSYDSYTDIYEAVQEAAEDTSSEFQAYIPKAVELAQRYLQTFLDLEGTSSQQTLVTVSGTKTVAKPAGYRFTNHFFLVKADGTRKLLDHATTSFLKMYSPDPTDTGEPRYFSTDYDADNFMLAPTPDAVYTIEGSVEADLSVLSTSNETNYFTQVCGDLLFYATMIQMMKFNMNSAGVAEWTANLNDARAGYNNQALRNKKVEGRSQGTSASTGDNRLIDKDRRTE
jgi:hypothetical protein